ncbi:uncharacterized protein LOC103572993 [Microplitis demolitor]|uniref:uncharacterized protein LOC103572993 n=1 Tax=Microplitis demolitor TaxID=69319 RepID=UPI0004CDA75A|nr:uncharacterized protein LOC103572993 [Microplitis demolitor]
METNNSDDKNVYAVVEFASSEFADKKDVDLVPSKWIQEEDGELLCQYPPVNDYHKLDKYTQELRDAKRDWAKYSVKILTYADTYAKGKKRLKRAYTTTDVRSTDDEHQQQNEIIKPTIISAKSVSNELNSISAMGEYPSISTNGENLQKEKTIPVDKLRPAPEVNEAFDFESLKEFINTKIQEQNMLIHRYLTNEKKSLQYDIKKYFDEIKNTLVVNKVPSDSHQSVSSAIEELGVTLPFKELEDFQAFDATLKSTASKKKIGWHYLELKRMEKTKPIDVLVRWDLLY